MRAFSNFINGKPADAADGATTKVVDPVTGEAYAEAALSGPGRRRCRHAGGRGGVRVVA